uniref:Secretogranin-1 n=1 Tax=Chelydra serpentina TaxID=8475 RepID=A0A8C3S529_CHESE
LFLKSFYQSLSSIGLSAFTEKVTRCIVEVLSTALSKPNAPPINPLCKDILKKSGRHKAEKKNENEEEQLEVRHLKESSDEKHQHASVEEERGQKEDNEEKHHHEEDESREEEEKHNGDSHSHEIRIHKGEKKHSLDIRGEEEEDDDETSYKRNNHSEEGSKEKKHHAEESGEAEHELPDKRSHSVAKSMEEFSPGDDKHSMGHRHSEEKMHSNEKRSHESEEEEEEEEEEESSERNHHESKEHGSYQYRGREESEEREEAEEEKRHYKPRHNHRKHRVGDSSKERRDHEGEKRNPLEESNEEENRFWDKKSHYQKHHYEEPEHHREEKKNYGKHSSEDVEEKRHAGRESEEYREQRHQNKENSEEEDKRHHLSGESEEERHEKKRHHDEPHEAHHGHRQSTGHYSTEERDSEEKRHYPGYDELDAEIEKRHDSEDQKQDNEDSTEKVRYGEKEYKSHFPAENEKRATIRYSPFYHRLQWKSRHLDKKDNMGDQILGSEQESRPSLNEKNFFPEYDYDWWEKKQLLDGLNHGHGEKRNLGRLHKLDMKRQYDRMDQLAQLLNYRKKSAEFPELYNSGEDLKKRHMIRSDKGNLSQRPLTEEEEKELENLAAMDLELQKIAEKFNDNRRG